MGLGFGFGLGLSRGRGEERGHGWKKNNDKNLPFKIEIASALNPGDLGAARTC